MALLSKKKKKPNNFCEDDERVSEPTGDTPGQPKTKDRAITGQFEHSVLGG